MADTKAEEAVWIRRIQGYMALFACLPANGKACEALELALGLDEGIYLDKIGRPTNPDDPESMKAWFEQLWAQGGVTAEEQKLIDWQNNPENMRAAVDEFEAVAAKLGS